MKWSTIQTIVRITLYEICFIFLNMGSMPETIEKSPVVHSVSFKNRILYIRIALLRFFFRFLLLLSTSYEPSYPPKPPLNHFISSIPLNLGN